MRISDWSSDVCSSDLNVLEHRCAILLAYAAFTANKPGLRAAVLSICCSQAVLLAFALGKVSFVMTYIRVPPHYWPKQACISAEIGSASCRERVCQYV